MFSRNFILFSIRIESKTFMPTVVFTMEILVFVETEWGYEGVWAAVDAGYAVWARGCEASGWEIWAGECEAV